MDTRESTDREGSVRRYGPTSLFVCLALIGSLTLVSLPGVAAQTSGPTSTVVGTQITSP
jgi:hypothetical protein